MDYLPVVFSVVMVVLTIVMSVVGIQLVIVLIEVKRTFAKLNTVIETAEAKLESLTSPLQHLGGMASGLKTGMKVFETFVGWLNRARDEK